eukprot:Phypoly_transcript_28204.p1 GENE.Phypoly_transcript_28204~~Phypoly_transcript_28204.p1  ORF type:complete len:125 (+),score=17.12 Phypoly_transcript_28204:76-450(+)
MESKFILLAIFVVFALCQAQNCSVPSVAGTYCNTEPGQGCWFFPKTCNVSQNGVALSASAPVPYNKPTYGTFNPSDNSVTLYTILNDEWEICAGVALISANGTSLALKCTGQVTCQVTFSTDCN